MKKSARLISIVAAAALTPLLLAGCMQANPNAIGSLSDGKGGSSTATAAPAVNATAAPTPTPTKVPRVKGDEISNSAANENKGFKATEKHSAQEVQNAVYSSKLIIGSLQSDTTLLGGNWAKNGYAQDDLDRYATFFTDKTFKGLLKDVFTKDEDATARTNLLLLTNYFPESDGQYVVCPSGDGSCLVPGYPEYTNLRYSDDKAGGVDVYFDIENRYVATFAGKRGYIPVKSTITLNMVADPSYTKDSGALPFIIDGWSGSYERGTFAQ